MTSEPPSPIEDIDLDVLGDTITFFVRALDIAVSRDLDERLKGLEVAKGKGKVTSLLFIDRHPGIRPSELSDWVMKDRAHITRIIENFIEHGLVTRRTDKSDSRAALLCVTEKGAAMAEEVRRIVREQEAEFFAELVSPEEHDQAVRILKGMYLKLQARGGLK